MYMVRTKVQTEERNEKRKDEENEKMEKIEAEKGMHILGLW